VSQMIAGPHVHICDSCVSVAADIIEHSKRPPSQRRSRLVGFLGTLRRVVTWAAGGRRRLIAAHPAQR
jgi:ATP-dependent protease Clp ATPase subunit